MAQNEQMMEEHSMLSSHQEVGLLLSKGRAGDID